MRVLNSVSSIYRTFLLISLLALFPVNSPAEKNLPAPTSLQVQQLFNEKKYTEVIKILTDNLDKIGYDQLVLLGKAYEQTDNSLAAINTFTLATNKKSKEENFEAKTLLGRQFLNIKKDRDALNVLKEVVQAKPNYEPAYLELERLYLKKNNKYEVRTLYADMLEHIGEKPKYLTRLCELSFQSGFFESAIQFCRRGIILNKKEVKNYVILALTFKETGRKEEAVKLLKKSADNFIDSFDAQMNYANNLDEEKNFLEAYTYYKKAFELDKKSNSALIGLAKVSVEIEKFQEAYTYFKDSCQLNKTALTTLRRAVVSLKERKEQNWIGKFEDLADHCGISVSY
jgi:tetratricopeptide (TPR) repeat protein